MQKRVAKELREAEKLSQQDVRQRRTQAIAPVLALAMARHPRLGAESPARSLPKTAFPRLLAFLHADRLALSLEKLDENVVVGRVPGPVDSPYEGGIFRIEFCLPPTYPFKPPRMRVLTRMFSAGIYNHGGDPFGLNPRDDEWSPALTMWKMLLQCYGAMCGEVGLNGEFAARVDYECVPNSERAKLWVEHPSEYVRLAREWTAVHATEEQVDAFSYTCHFRLTGHGCNCGRCAEAQWRALGSTPQSPPG